MWADLREYVRTRAKAPLVPLVAAIAISSDVMSLAALPDRLLASIRALGAAAAVLTLVYLIYGFGKFRQSRQAAEAASAVKTCCRYLRFGPHPVHYDKDLVTRLTRGIWLRKHHPQWTVARLDADSQCLFLAGGADDGVIEGLVFSVIKLGNGVSCRYPVRAADITDDETRLQPTGFQIRAAAQPACFQVDLVDPTPEEAGAQIEMELFVAGILGALGDK